MLLCCTVAILVRVRFTGTLLVVHCTTTLSLHTSQTTSHLSRSPACLPACRPHAARCSIDSLRPLAGSSQKGIPTGDSALVVTCPLRFAVQPPTVTAQPSCDLPCVSRAALSHERTGTHDSVNPRVPSFSLSILSAHYRLRAARIDSGPEGA